VWQNVVGVAPDGPSPLIVIHGLVRGESSFSVAIKMNKNDKACLWWQCPGIGFGIRLSIDEIVEASFGTLNVRRKQHGETLVDHYLITIVRVYQAMCIRPTSRQIEGHVSLALYSWAKAQITCVEIS